MLSGFGMQVTEKRMNYVSNLTNLRDQVSSQASLSSEICEQIDNLIDDTVKQTEISEDIVKSDPMISMNEVNDKMSELNNKIVLASPENKFLRITLGKLSNS